MTRVRSRVGHLRGLAQLAVSMCFRDKTKLAGSLSGVFFACLLTAQQGGTFSSLITKNTMIVDHAGGDIWVMPAETEQIMATSTMDRQVELNVRAVPGVAWAEPLMFASGNIIGPTGDSEGMTLIGYDTRKANFAPWWVVQGDSSALRQPGAIVVEDSQRELLGAVDLGSVREINGSRVHVVGLTRGLVGFGPSWAFTDISTAATIAGRSAESPSFLLVGLDPSSDSEEVIADIEARNPNIRAKTTADFRSDAIIFLLTRTPIGITFGTAALFGLLIGFVIVALTMLSAVVDNLREFGMLKAIGATMWDLAFVLAVQAVIYGVLGGILGVTAYGLLADAVRSPTITMQLPTIVAAMLTPAMVVLCLFSALMSLWRLRAVEPGMVFR